MLQVAVDAQVGEEPQKFTKTQLNETLRMLWDLMDYYWYEWYPTLDTAKGIKEKNLQVDKITGAIHKRNFTKTTKTDIRVQLEKYYKIPYELTNDYIKFTYKGVPVEIKILKYRYHFFNHPDPVFYNYDEYKLANPWNAYWEARESIRWDTLTGF